MPAQRAGRGVDAGDDDRRRRPQPRPQGDLAFDGDVEPRLGSVGRLAGLLDRGVDVAHRGVEEGLRHVDVGPVVGRAGVLDDEPVQREVRRLDADVVVGAGFGGDSRPLFDRTRDRGLAVDHRVLAEEIDLPRRADGCHRPLAAARVRLRLMP